MLGMGITRGELFRKVYLVYRFASSIGLLERFRPGGPLRSATRGSTNKPSVRQIAAGAEGCVGFVKIFYLIFIPDTRGASYFTSWLNLTRKGHPRPSEGGGFNSFSQERIRCSKAAERIIARQKGVFPKKRSMLWFITPSNPGGKLSPG